MKRILVAGATGYLGGFVAQELKRRGHFVRAVARSQGKLENLRDSLDEIVQAEVTRSETLEGLCDGIDIVFSSIGITRQRDGLTFRDVDYQGNLNLLQVARAARVEKFIYVSVFNGPGLRHLDIIGAHEDFVDELKASGMNYAVLRPTGYFRDMVEFLAMAKKGRVYLIGKGANRSNPIHGADLAVCCVDAIQGERQEIDVGGPEIFSYREVAELAFRCLGKQPRVTSVPVPMVNILIAVTRLFRRHEAELIAFFTSAMTTDAIAPATGTHRLSSLFEQLSSAEVAR